MSLNKRNRDVLHVMLTIHCQRNPNHTLGVAVLYLEPHPHSGRITVGNGLAWDDYGKAVGNCSECAVTGQGHDQQVSRARIESELARLFDAGRTSGHLRL